MTDAELRMLADRLLLAMANARSHYHEDQRAGTREAVAALGKFVTTLISERRGSGLSLLGIDDVLGHLSLALAGLDQGSVDSLLQPNVKRRKQVLDARDGRTLGLKAGLTLQEHMQRAVVAASLQGLYLAGHPLQSAAKTVVKELKGSPVLATVKNGNPVNAVRRWRSALMELSDGRLLSEMSDDEPRKAAVGAYNSTVASIEARIAAGAPKALVALFAVNMLSVGYGMSKSYLVPTKPQRSSA